MIKRRIKHGIYDDMILYWMGTLYARKKFGILDISVRVSVVENKEIKF